ncbi:MAG: rod shape-determining protein RodA [Calditrichia bacterium]
MFKRLDFTILLSVLGLVGMGLVALYSSSFTAMSEGVGTNYFYKQMIWSMLGTGIMIIIYFIPNRLIFESAYLLYAVSLLLLVLVIFFGKVGLGAERWIRLGPLVVQPSEIAKLSTILALARYISREKMDLNHLQDFFLASLIVFFPFILIVQQPDLGTSMVILALALPMYYWGGLKGGNLALIMTPVVIIFASFQFYAFLIIMILLVGYLIYSQRSKFVIVFNFFANIIMGLITPFLWNHLKPYQQNRIKVFLNPEADPRGAGYQIIQSKVAIGSGGFSGKGFMQGSQTQLRFLPEQHTDFIFAVVGEEFGFVGILAGLVLFYLFLMRGVKLATVLKSRFNQLVTIGIVTVIGFHVVVNIGMTIGLLPVTGLPLPFMSYGGSALLTNMAMVGILLNFYRNRYEY